MFGGFLGQILTPWMQLRAVTAKAAAGLWKQADDCNHEIWKSPEDRAFMEAILWKPWVNYTDKEILIVDMLMLKYNDRPCDADLSKDRVLN